MSEGTLITFEGLDASGKSTLIDEIAKQLENNHEVSIVNEFSQSPGGEELRSLLDADRLLEIENQSLTITSLLVADYFYQIENRIYPELKKGSIILKDRYIDTLHACQIDQINRDYGVENEPRSFLNAVEELTPITPNLTIFLSVPKQELIERIKQREEEIKQRDIAELARREEIYMERIKNATDRFIIYENRGTVDEAKQEIVDIILKNI